jgi:hypothetical protein
MIQLPFCHLLGDPKMPLICPIVRRSHSATADLCDAETLSRAITFTLCPSVVDDPKIAFGVYTQMLILGMSWIHNRAFGSDVTCFVHDRYDLAHCRRYGKINTDTAVGGWDPGKPRFTNSLCHNLFRHRCLRAPAEATVHLSLQRTSAFSAATAGTPTRKVTR